MAQTLAIIRRFEPEIETIDAARLSLQAEDEVVLCEVLACLRASMSYDKKVEFVINRAKRRPRSLLVDLTVEASGKPPRHLMLKTYRPTSARETERARDRVSVEFAILTKLQDVSGVFERVLLTVDPVICLPEQLTLVTKKRVGVAFQILLERAAGLLGTTDDISRVTRVAAACGIWLKNFQLFTRVQGATFDLSVVVDDINNLLRACETPSGPLTSNVRRQIVTYCEALRVQTTAADLTVSGVHGDYFAGNILVNGAEIAVLDFEMFRHGSSWADATYFLHQLRTLLFKPIFRPSVVHAVHKAFVSGYGADSMVEFGQRDPAFTLFSILHVARRLRQFADTSFTSLGKRWYATRIARSHIRDLSSNCV